MKLYIAGPSSEGKRAMKIAAMLRRDGYETVGSWPTFVPGKETESFYWDICVKEIVEADVLLMSAPFRQFAKLRGALFEAGIALGLGKPIIVYDVLRDRDLGTWTQCEGVYHAWDRPSLLALLESMNVSP